jgi:hypothetical protein
MESLCTPAVATAALFTSLLFLDLFRREYTLLPGHAIFGILATLLMAVLCQHNATLTAWGLFVLPFIFLLIGWMTWAIKQQEQPSMPPYPIRPKPARNPCRTCDEQKESTCNGCERPCPACRCKRPSQCESDSSTA